METPSSPPKVTRAARVYGRRKQPEVPEADPLADLSFTDASPAFSNHNSPAQSVSQHDLPPSSSELGIGDASYMDDDDCSHDEAAQSCRDNDMGDDVLPAGYGRPSLREQLALIDKQYDEEEMEVEQESGTRDKEDSGPLSQGDASRRSEGPLAKPSSSPQLVDNSSRSPSPIHRRANKRRLRINDSDSDSPARRASPPSPQTSPSALHPINTPHSRSSPTPPTSEDMSSTRRRGKEKQRNHSAEHDDSDAQPTGADTRSRRKSTSTRKTREKRTKAPSNKEQLETRKMTARIIADQRLNLPRSDRKLTISSLFEKLRSGLRPHTPSETAAPDPAAVPSDPIQPFSSSPHHAQSTSFATKLMASRLDSPHPAPGTADPQESFFATGLLRDESELKPTSRRPLPKSQNDSFLSNGLLGSKKPLPGADSSDDEELPDIRQMLEQDKKKREQAEARKKLQAAKLQYINRNPEVEVDEGDSDLEVVYDDMHAVADEEDKDRRARKAKHIGESVGRHHQLTLAGKAKAIRSPTKSTPLRGSKKDFDLLAAAAAPSFSIDARAKTRSGKERESMKVNPGDLNRLLLHASEKQSRELTAQKEAEFYKRAGQRRDQLPEVDKMDVMQSLVQKGMKNTTREVSEDEDDEGQDSDENDGEWTPESGVRARADDDDDEPGEVASEELPIATDDERDDRVDMREEEEENDENEENMPMKVRRSIARPRAVIDSDDENDENMQPPTERVLVAETSLVLDSSPRLGVPLLGLHHRGSMSSMEERLEDGTDKENDCRLMFDRGEDKENTAIASQCSSVVVSPLASLHSGGSFFSLQENFTRTASSSSGGGADTTLLGDERIPFKELSTGDDDEEFFFSPSNKARLPGQQEGTPTKSPFGAKSQSLRPLQLRGGGKGLSSLFDDGELEAPEEDLEAMPCSLQPAAVIHSGLSQFFEASAKDIAAASPAPLQLGKAGGFSQFMTPEKDDASPQKLKTQNLSLTLGPSLQPALEVDENLMRRADEIFEKEQGFIVGETMVAEKPVGKPEMFINKHGFLTQTRPASSPTSPFFNQTSPAFSVPGSSVQRRPLSTLALSAMDEDDDEDEANPRRRRLRRRSFTPEDMGGYRSSPSPSPVKRNAFDVHDKKSDHSKARLPKKRLDKSEFVAGEAEESDEDAAFGFGLLRKKNDEEELDGEDQDQVLEGLVDDAAMDVATLNEDMVLEKVQEHRALDDAADEKIARDAAEGKLRVKRRNNLLDFEDDESDEDDYDARRARERMAKKRRIEGDTLEAIEKNPETRAFAAAYKVEDDEDEFAHLEHDELTLVGGTSQETFNESDENEENEEQEVVDAIQLRKQLQRVARGEEVIETIDVHDVAWVDNDDDDMDDEIRIKEITSAQKQPVGRSETSAQMEWELIKPRGGASSADLARQQKWAKSEGGSRNLGTGRASAVTGMRPSMKAGGGSLASRRKGGAESSASQAGKQAARLAKAPSALSAVSGRRARFDC